MNWNGIVGAAVFILVVNPVSLFAFGSHFTHPQLTEKAIEKLSEKGLDDEIRRKWGLENGLETEAAFLAEVEDGIPDTEIERNNQVMGTDFQRHLPTRMNTSYSLRYLVISGSEAEDHPTERAQHHFHDPVSNTGLDNDRYGIGTLADFVTLLYPPAKQGDAYRLFCSLAGLCEPAFHLDGTSARERVQGSTSNAYPMNLFAWPDTREYLYRALTRILPKERKHYWAMTFFSLGHDVHLLEDMGVPAHVRNDFLWDHIWHGVLRGRNLEGYLDHSEGVARYWIPAEPETFASLPDFWDRDGTPGRPGLAEYINENFLSEGTVFNRYPSPLWKSEAVYPVMASDGVVDRVRYLSGETTDGLEVRHLAATGLLYTLWKELGNETQAARTSYLDPYCYDDYSRLIIPRVGSYISGMLNYFFRGELALIHEGTDRFRVKNLSQEPLIGGRFEIYQDQSDGSRFFLASLDQPETRVLRPNELSDPLTVHFPEDLGSSDFYTVVYRGQMGEERGAALGSTLRSKIVFATTRNGMDEIFIMSPDGRQATPLIQNNDPEATFGRPGLSPDGRRLVFHLRRDGEDRIILFDLRSRKTDDLGRGFWPSWSPDGEKIVFQRSTGINKHDLFTVNTADFHEEMLTDDAYDNIYPVWSPDGSKIAYSSARNGVYQVAMIDSHGTSTTVVTQGNRNTFKPAWSPDGGRVAFERPSKAVYSNGEPVFINIHLIDLAQGVETDLTGLDASTHHQSARYGSPVWSPDGRYLLAEYWEEGATGSDLILLNGETGAFVENMTIDSPADEGYPAFGLGSF